MWQSWFPSGAAALVYPLQAFGFEFPSLDLARHSTSQRSHPEWSYYRMEGVSGENKMRMVAWAGTAAPALAGRVGNVRIRLNHRELAWEISGLGPPANW